MNRCHKRKGPMSVFTTPGPYGLAIRSSQATRVTNVFSETAELYHEVNAAGAWASQDDFSIDLFRGVVHDNDYRKRLRPLGVLPAHRPQRACDLSEARTLLPVLGSA